MLDLGEVVLNFHHGACEGTRIIGEGTNLGIEEFIGFVVEGCKTRLQDTNV